MVLFYYILSAVDFDAFIDTKSTIYNFSLAIDLLYLSKNKQKFSIHGKSKITFIILISNISIFTVNFNYIKYQPLVLIKLKWRKIGEYRKFHQTKIKSKFT